MKCNNRFHRDTKHLEFAGLFRAQDPKRCGLTRCKVTVCPMELPQLH